MLMSVPEIQTTVTIMLPVLTHWEVLSAHVTWDMKEMVSTAQVSRASPY